MDNARLREIHADPLCVTDAEVQSLVEDAVEFRRAYAKVSMRDEFAMSALTGLLGGSAFQRADRRHAAMAAQAYEFADAMLDARGKKGA